MSQRCCAVILAGVAGVGKTTVGRLLAADLGWDYCEGDELHPSGNLKKMMAGRPLTDEDRWPWLERLRGVIDTAIREDRPTIVVCSLLKRSYRDYLIDDLDGPRAVFLTADEGLIRERFSRRGSHFFPEGLLQSQLDSWEPPQEGLLVDASQAPAEIVAEIKKQLSLEKV